MIETPRLTLRDWTEADLDPFLRHTNTPEVMRWLGGVLPPDELARRTRERIMRWQEERGFTFWVVERKSDGEFLGFCGLKILDAPGAPNPGANEIGWRFRKDAWGQGYAREAATASLDHGFGPLGMDEIFALTVRQNEASWGLMHRLGMRRREDLDFEEQSWAAGLGTVIVYGITSGEWREMRGKTDRD